MISPGYPAEMGYFTRGLHGVGAQVVGLGDGPAQGLPPEVRRVLQGYIQVRSLWDEPAVIAEVREVAARVPIHRVECLWEPGMLLAAGLREALGLPGMTRAETIPFRDKVKMKDVLDGAGIRTPRHALATTVSEIREAATHIGFPLILKPVAGAGSADTYRVGDPDELERTIVLLGHVDEVNVEEFVEGPEYTYDTVCAGGEILFENVCSYRPNALLARQLQWVSPQTICRRDIHTDELRDGVAMGRRVLKALGFRTGFSHMEWFRKPDGEVVFGEIACRPPGARSVDIMNVASDLDLYTGWAEAVCHGRLSQPLERRYNSAIVFKRAEGEGTIRAIEGLGPFLHELGEHVVAVDLLPVGARRRNWKQTLLSDGQIILRHPDLATTLALADRVGTHVRMIAS
jgi:hypothetical protein